jgi:hypothetical protein
MRNASQVVRRVLGVLRRKAEPFAGLALEGVLDRFAREIRSPRPPEQARARYLRWASLEATIHALRHPVSAERYQRNKRRHGRQRGAKVAQIDIAHAIWNMLTRNEEFAPRAPLFDRRPDRLFRLAPGSEASDFARSSRSGGHGD